MRKLIAVIMTLAAFGLAASTAVAEHVNLGNLGTGAQNKVKNACGSDYQSNGDGFGCAKPCGNGGNCSVWCDYKNNCSGSTASISGPGHGKVGTIVGVLHPPQGGGVQGPGANSPPGHAVGPVHVKPQPVEASGAGGSKPTGGTIFVEHSHHGR